MLHIWLEISAHSSMHVAKTAAPPFHKPKSHYVLTDAEGSLPGEPRTGEMQRSEGMNLIDQWKEMEWCTNLLLLL